MVSKSDLRSMYPEALLLGDRLVVPWRWIEVVANPMKSRDPQTWNPSEIPGEMLMLLAVPNGKSAPNNLQTLVEIPSRTGRHLSWPVGSSLLASINPNFIAEVPGMGGNNYPIIPLDPHVPFLHRYSMFCPITQWQSMEVAGKVIEL